jgi:hypothetical protein
VAKDIPKTAGNLNSCACPSGRNAGQRFQQLINQVLAGLDLDDVISSDSKEEEHLHHLRRVLERLQKFCLVLNVAKCRFEVHEVDSQPIHHCRWGGTTHSARADDPEVSAASRAQAAWFLQAVYTRRSRLSHAAVRSFSLA